MTYATIEANGQRFVVVPVEVWREAVDNEGVLRWIQGINCDGNGPEAYAILLKRLAEAERIMGSVVSYARPVDFKFPDYSDMQAWLQKPQSTASPTCRCGTYPWPADAVQIVDSVGMVHSATELCVMRAKV
jgi:hypothetical protein